MLFLSATSNAQIKSAFAANKSTVSCPTETVYFYDSSQGNPTSWTWAFGDNTSSTLANPSHQYAKSGRYTVSLIVKNSLMIADTSVATIIVLGPTVQYTKIVDTTCSTISVKFSSKATGIGPLTYMWDFGDGKTSTSLTSNVTHVYKGAMSYAVNLTVRDTSGCSAKVGETLTYGSIAAVLPTAPKTLIASRECIDAFGWTNYYHDNSTPLNKNDDILLLSIFKNNNNIGKVEDGTLQVKVGATEKAGTSTGILLNSPAITNPSGYHVMNRYWSVTPAAQPTTPVGVRFYFNNQDVTDINGSYPSHDAEFHQLIFYKTKNGNPDPSTNLQNATDILSIFPGSEADENHWTYTFTGAGSHAAEFLVNNFNGGGGGGITVNGETLPVKLISFNGKLENSAVKLNWSVSNELNIDSYTIQASADGRMFTTVGKVQSKGNHAATNNYTFNDTKGTVENAKFYKLLIVDRDGKKNYSEVIKMTIAALSNKISMYPVPANNNITITSKSITNKNCVVEVYNSLGLRVMQQNKYAAGNSFQINTSNLPDGRYKVVIYSNEAKIGDGNFIILR
jgi:PKD repeat protein